MCLLRLSFSPSPSTLSWNWRLISEPLGIEAGTGLPLGGVYKPQDYRKFQEYLRTTPGSGWSGVFSHWLSCWLWFLGALSGYQAWSGPGACPYYDRALYLGILLLDNYSCLPFGIYDTFVIESVLALNRTTPGLSSWTR